MLITCCQTRSLLLFAAVALSCCLNRHELVVLQALVPLGKGTPRPLAMVSYDQGPPLSASYSVLQISIPRLGDLGDVQSEILCDATV